MIDCGCAIHSDFNPQAERVVYSRTIEKPIFHSVKHQELAFKEVESDRGYGWVALKFKLKPGDIIRVIRQEGKDGELRMTRYSQLDEFRCKQCGRFSEECDCE